MSDREPLFSRPIEIKAPRKLNAQRAGTQRPWFGLGMFGVIGWSVTVPTLLGALLGLWLDRHHPGAHSWTLALLVAGLIWGVPTRGIGFPIKTRPLTRSPPMTPRTIEMM